MFHPEFRPRMSLHLVPGGLSLETYQQFDVAHYHLMVAHALEQSLQTGSLSPREVSDQMAETLLAAMSGHAPECMEDPFGVYDELAKLPPDLLQDIYNHLLAKEEELIMRDIPARE